MRDINPHNSGVFLLSVKSIKDKEHLCGLVSVVFQVTFFLFSVVNNVHCDDVFCAVHFICCPCRNELLGLAGMVKITSSEENLNHNQHSNETDACTVIGSGVSCADTTESNKRLFMSSIYSW